MAPLYLWSRSVADKETVWTRNRGCGDLLLMFVLGPVLLLLILAVLL